MWQRFLKWLEFKWNHEHEMECYGPDTRMMSGERWYWHIHGCWCGHEISIMTNGCNLPEVQEAIRARRNR